MLAEKEEAFTRIQTSYINLILYVFIVLFLILLLRNHEGKYPYHAVKVVNDMLLGKYTATASFMEIRSWSQCVVSLFIKIVKLFQIQSY